MASEGTTGTTKIQRLEKGNKKRTARHADVMNELIDAINKLYELKVSGGLGKLIVADGNVVLQLNTTECPEE